MPKQNDLKKGFSCTVQSAWSKPFELKRKAKTLEDAIKLVKEFNALSNDFVKYSDFRFRGEIIKA